MTDELPLDPKKRPTTTLDADGRCRRSRPPPLCEKKMNKKIENLRANKVVAWLFALSMGLVFRYIYGIVKNSIFAGVRRYFESSSSTPPEVNNVLFIIKFNFSIDLASSFIAAVVCGALLVYIYREKSMSFCLGSVVVFLVSSSRLWRFWKYPELEMQISGLIGPLLAGLMLIFATWVILKISQRIRNSPTEVQ